MIMGGQQTVYFRYTFRNPGGTVRFTIELDPESLTYIRRENSPPPEWTRLDYLSCEDCKIRNKNGEHCPVAVNISHVVEAFKDVYSYDVTDVIVETEERTYFKEQVPVQKAVSSLLGIIMVTSGCEDLDRLRPMVRFHLPFATIEETVYRAASTYLLAQYFRAKNGLEPDWDMKELVGIYQRIAQINANICKRLQIASSKDASLNAVVILDTFAQMLPLSIEDTLKSFEYLFGSYLDQ
jgi:hypothetical protein